MRTYVINEIFYSLQGEGVRAGTANLFLRFTGCNETCRVETHGFDCDTEFASGRKMTLDEIVAELRAAEDAAHDAETSAPPLPHGRGSELLPEQSSGIHSASPPLPLSHSPTLPRTASADLSVSASPPLPLSPSPAPPLSSSPSARARTCGWVILTGGEPALQVDRELIDRLHAESYRLAIETNGSIALPDGIDWITVSPKVAEHAIRQRKAHEVKYVRGHGQAIPRTVVQAEHKLISPAFNGDRIDPRALAWCIGLVKSHPEWRLSIQQHKSWGIR